MDRVTIVGAGAIGGVTGAHLARAGHPVLLVDRDGAHVSAIRRHGLAVQGAARFTVPVPACRPEEVTGPIRLLLLAVKTLHTTEALGPLVPLVTSDGYVVSMQNGLEIERIAALVGPGRAVDAFLTFGAYYERPGHVVYSAPASLKVGEPDGRVTPRVEALAGLLSDFHPAQATDNIRGFKWGKLLLGLVYFGTALVDRDVIDVLADAASRRILGALVAEGAAVADALGVRVEPVDGFDPRAFVPGMREESPAAARAWAAQVAYWRRGTSRRTGIWRDLAVRRRPTEAEPILGALIAAAERAGLPVPGARALLGCLREVEGGRRPLDGANLAALETALR